MKNKLSVCAIKARTHLYSTIAVAAWSNVKINKERKTSLVAWKLKNKMKRKKSINE